MKPEKSCLEIKDELFSYLKRELEGEDRAFVKTHLEQCAQCRTESDKMSGLLDDLADLFPEIECQDSSWERIQTRIRLDRRAYITRTKNWIIVSLSFIVLFGAVCLFWLLTINDQVVAALGKTAESLGIDLSWLLTGPVSGFLAPLIFIGLCSIMALALSPLLLKKAKEVKQEMRELEQLEGLSLEES